MHIGQTYSNRFIKFILYLCIISIFFWDWLYFVFGIGSRYMTWTPEFVSLFLFIYIPAVLAVRKEWRLPPRYSVWLCIYIIHIAIGFIINSVAVGPMIAGIRQFCRFIPIFVLPAVIRFEENEMKILLKLILILALVQFPVTIWQRFYLYANNPSGDPIGGTLGANTSGVLSVFLLMVLTFLTAFYLKNEIPLRFFMLFCTILFIPTTLNETKITLPLLPLAFLIPVIFTRKSLTRVPSKILKLCLLLSSILFLFIFIYNSFSNRNVLQFYSQEERVGSYSEARIIPIITALDKVLHSGTRTALYGYGAGNVSVSYSQNLESKLLKKLSAYNPGNVSITKILWETGYVGAFIFFMFFGLIFLDTIKFSKQDNLIGMIAIGMSAATTILIISFFYTTPLDQNVFAYNYFFISGYLASSDLS